MCSNGDLSGILIRFHQLNKAIMRIIVKREPINWAWGIGIFALTFSECVRFVWYHVVLSSLIEHEQNIPMAGDDYWMSVLPKEWLNISNCVRGTPRSGETNETQLEDDKYLMPGLDRLK